MGECTNRSSVSAESSLTRLGARHLGGGVGPPPLPRNGIDTGVFGHWLTRPDDPVHQDLAALEAARIYGVRCELAFFEPMPAARAQHKPLTKEY